MKLLTMMETAGRLRMSVAKTRVFVEEHKDIICVSFGSKSVRIIEEKLTQFILNSMGQQVITPKA